MLQLHNHPNHDGRYVDAALTHASVLANLHQDTSFIGTIQGNVYAQPLYVDNGSQGPDLVIVVTEDDIAFALSAVDGSVVWQTQMGSPLHGFTGEPYCGNIDPLGITGTPAIDPSTGLLFLDALDAPDGGPLSQHHVITALSLDGGAVQPGWPIDVGTQVGFTGGGFIWPNAYEGQRGALLVQDGVLYVPYGGRSGDCGNYQGAVVGVPLTNPAGALGWETRALQGGAWSPMGVTSDGNRIFVGTGNTGETDGTYGDGDSAIHLLAGPLYSASTADFYAPPNWLDLDDGDLDLGSSGVTLLDLPGSTPSELAILLGKDGNMYLLDRTNLGGVGGPATILQVAIEQITGSPSTYRTAQGTYVVFKATGSDCPGAATGQLVSMRLAPGSPPGASTAWCGSTNGHGSPISSSSDGQRDAIVWAVGAEGDNLLHAFDGDTGAALAAVGNQAASMRRFSSPMIAKGRVFVASDGQVYAFTTR